MDIKLKQRLVGALALTAVAIILLPMLLDGSPEELRHPRVDIPTAPSFAVEPIDMAEFRDKMERMKKNSQDRLPVEFPPIPDDEEPGVLHPDSDKGIGEWDLNSQYELDANKIPVSWTIRLGTFRNENNAVRLRESLRAEDKIAYILKSDDDQGRLFRVFVGPMLNKQKLLSIATKIESKFNLKGQIIRYRSSNDVNLLGGN